MRGEMRLVGPRPYARNWCRINFEYSFYKLRYLYKPGLSGWAQVNYPYASSIKDTQNKLSYDLYYVENFQFSRYFNFLQDHKIDIKPKEIKFKSILWNKKKR